MQVIKAKFVLQLFAFLIFALSTAPCHAAEPSDGADCSTFASGATAIANNQLLTCTTNVWTLQAILIGNSITTCDSGNAGALHYNTTTNSVEFCNGTYWTPF